MLPVDIISPIDLMNPGEPMSQNSLVSPLPGRKRSLKRGLASDAENAPVLFEEHIMMCTPLRTILLPNSSPNWFTATQALNGFDESLFVHHLASPSFAEFCETLHPMHINIGDEASKKKRARGAAIIGAFNFDMERLRCREDFPRLGRIISSVRPEVPPFTMRDSHCTSAVLQSIATVEQPAMLGLQFIGETFLTCLSNVCMVPSRLASTKKQTERAPLPKVNLREFTAIDFIAVHSEGVHWEVTSESCSCSRSNCLKRYCACFGNQKHCGLKCTCRSCLNMSNCRQSEAWISAQIRLKYGATKAGGTAVSCSCSGSTRCLKRYCMCYDANKHCGSECTCLACQNQNLEK